MHKTTVAEIILERELWSALEWMINTWNVGSINTYRLKEAKELFENIEDDLDDFYHLSQAVKTGQLSERNFKRLEELLSKFHVIKAAMRIIENKRGDYHL